jgi:hypothetical protein
MNENGGLFHKGKRYILQRKIDVVRAHCNLTSVNPTQELTIRAVAAEATVSVKFTFEVLKEFKTLGYITDPCHLAEETNEKRKWSKENRSRRSVGAVVLLESRRQSSPLVYLHDTDGKRVGLLCVAPISFELLQEAIHPSRFPSQIQLRSAG